MRCLCYLIKYTKLGLRCQMYGRNKKVVCSGPRLRSLNSFLYFSLSKFRTIPSLSPDFGLSGKDDLTHPICEDTILERPDHVSRKQHQGTKWKQTKQFGPSSLHHRREHFDSWASALKPQLPKKYIRQRYWFLGFCSWLSPDFCILLRVEWSTLLVSFHDWLSSKCGARRPHAPDSIRRGYCSLFL